MSYQFYGNYITNMSKSPKDEWREAYQESLNDFWENTSTLEEVMSQTANGSTTYNKEEVQITSIINPTTGKDFGDWYRKIVFRDYNTASYWLGKMYQWDNHTWLTINTNTRIGSLKTAIIQQCNNTLRWIDTNGIVQTWDCVFQRQISSTGLLYGSEGYPQIKADAMVFVQLNDITKLIEINQRFLFDKAAFQIVNIDTHYSDTLCTLYVHEVPIQSDDDLTNGIASNQFDIEPINDGIIITPNVERVAIGDTTTYTVYNYDNGALTNDTFTITASGAIPITYTLTIIDGNHFSIENEFVSDTPLTITCTDNVTSDSRSIDIILGGKW